MSTADARFTEAAAAESRGDLESAASIYEALLALDVARLRALLRLAAIDLARNNPSGAAERYAAARSLRPEVPQISYNEALAYIAAGNLDAAVEASQRAVSLAPDYQEALLALMGSLRGLGRHGDAVAIGRSSLNRGVDSAALATEHAFALAAAGEHEEAVNRFGDAVKHGADRYEMRFHAGCSELARDRPQSALAAFDGALAGRPHWLEARINRAIALNGLGRFEEACTQSKALLAAAPRVDVLRTLARAQHGLQLLDEAVASLRSALAISADDHESWELLATIYSEANVSGPLLLTCIDEALRTWNESFADANQRRLKLLSLRTGALYALSNMDEAERTVDELVALAEDFPLALGHQAFSHAANFNWERFEEIQERIRRGILRGETVTTPFQVLPLLADASLQKICATTYMSTLYPPTSEPLAELSNPTDKKIRIGYLSADFRDHPVSHLLAATVEAHDRSAFEIIGLSSHQVTDADPLTRRLMKSFDRFEVLSALTDRKAAELIRSLGVDILVDLNGLTAGERPAIAAARPAPIQVNFLGYPGTIGAPHFDYLIADAGVVPVGFEQHYVETVVRLPRSLLPPGDSRPARLVSPGRSALSLPEDALVVAAFHSGFKVSPDIFGIWMRLLQRQPKAVLWMSVGSERGRSRLQAAAERCGVSSERIVFAQRIPDRIDHLHRLTEADLLLDTPVYNSHSSALDALWCGVPIVTARSDAFASRVCGALLELIGLGSLVAGSLEEYEDIAAALIQSPERLKELRVEVSKGIEGAALFDVQRYTRELEGAFHHMHDRRTQGLGPASFDVPRS